MLLICISAICTYIHAGMAIHLHYGFSCMLHMHARVQYILFMVCIYDIYDTVYTHTVHVCVHCIHTYIQYTRYSTLYTRYSTLYTCNKNKIIQHYNVQLNTVHTHTIQYNNALRYTTHAHMV